MAQGHPKLSAKSFIRVAFQESLYQDTFFDSAAETKSPFAAGIPFALNQSPKRIAYPTRPFSGPKDVFQIIESSQYTCSETSNPKVI